MQKHTSFRIRSSRRSLINYFLLKERNISWQHEDRKWHGWAQQMKPELQRYIHINNEIEKRCGSISVSSQRPPVRTFRISISLSVNRYRAWLLWVSGQDGAVTAGRFFHSLSWCHLEGGGEMLYLSVQISCNVSEQQGQLNASFGQKMSSTLKDTGWGLNRTYSLNTKRM